MPVFEKIGRHIDATMAQPRYDKLFAVDRERVVIAVGDTQWGDRVLLTELRVDEIAQALVVCALPVTEKQLSEAVCHGWAEWSRRARKSFRRGVPAWNNQATASVGGILFLCPEFRAKLAQLAVSGEVPVIAIAIDSAGTTRKRLKCRVRAAVFPWPAWARASGHVAGCA
ncbi:hypothetical protein JQ628_23520 [Bradyrhizobium lablabi]|uniref:hypothetical protein n=1 Tax=Bradyrhizobium lablabi TaxID=722472 RepID=UPI001BA8D94F|nr:hypothetical protein [Bradyrhizobium lablabi]MBR1124516.1 hypothetical protein [Bradyrhizobium lablabi]